MKTALLFVVATCLAAAPMANAQTATPTNSSANGSSAISYGSKLIDGNMSATAGAIQTLEDELAERAANAKFNASDYKQWNETFRHSLNEEFYKFAEQVKTQIETPLQPDVQIYQNILGDSSLAPDQAAALKQPALIKLNADAKSLEPAYNMIYASMVKDLMGWLPYVQVTNFSNAANHHVLNRVFSSLVSLTGVGLIVCAGVDSQLDSQYNNNPYGCFKSTNARTRFDYKIISLDGSVVGFKGHFDSQIYNEITNNSPNNSVEVDVSDVSNLLSVLDNYISAEQYVTTPILNQFFVPEIKKGCQSQACLSLKEADLKKAVQDLSTKIDQPFVVTFADGQNVTIPAPTFSPDAYLKYLSQPMVDSSLPFDLK